MILVTVKPAWLLLVRGEFGENIFIILLNLQNEQMFLWLLPKSRTAICIVVAAKINVCLPYDFQNYYTE